MFLVYIIKLSCTDRLMFLAQGLNEPLFLCVCHCRLHVISSTYHTTTIYWHTGNPYITLLYSTGLLAVPITIYHTLLAHGKSLYHPTIFYRTVRSPYITLPYSTGQCAVPISLYHTLQAHGQSLYHSTILY